MRDANHCVHALGFGIKLQMAKKTAYENRYLVPLDRQINQAIPHMTQLGVIEMLVTRKEGWLALPMQKGDDFIVTTAFILHPCSLLRTQTTHKTSGPQAARSLRSSWRI
jgi:hypothetical protein